MQNLKRNINFDNDLKEKINLPEIEIGEDSNIKVVKKLNIKVVQEHKKKKKPTHGELF